MKKLNIFAASLFLSVTLSFTGFASEGPAVPVDGETMEMIGQIISQMINRETMPSEEETDILNEESAVGNQVQLVNGPVKMREGEFRDTTLSDRVELTDDTAAVITGEGIAIAYKIPEGEVYVLTQDYLHQAELYGQLYKSPLEAALSFLKENIHMNIYDAENEIDVYIRVIASDLSLDYPDALKMTDTERSVFSAQLNKLLFEGGASPSWGKIGNNSYCFFNCIEDYGHIYLFTTAGGYLIIVDFDAATKADAKKGISLLEGLAVSVYE